MFEIDPEDFKTSQAKRLDSQLLVRFFNKEVQDKAKTLAEGRPIFKEKEYVEIRIAGKRDAQACRPATFADKNRFAQHYKAFKDRVTMPTEGTPLSEWPLVTRSLAEELSFLNVKTVEQLSGMGDTQLSGVMGGYGLRDKAIKWLEYASSEKVAQDKQVLLNRVNELEAKLEAVLDLHTPQTEPAPLDAELVVEEKAEAEAEAEEEPEAKTTRSRRKRK